MKNKLLQLQHNQHHFFSLRVKRFHLSRLFQNQLSSGVMLSDGLTKPCDVREIKRGCYEFRLFEGKNRQIRRMVEMCGTHVTRLKRVSFGKYALGGIVSGQYRFESLAEPFKERLRRVSS